MTPFNVEDMDRFAVDDAATAIAADDSTSAISAATALWGHGQGHPQPTRSQRVEGQLRPPRPATANGPGRVSGPGRQSQDDALSRLVGDIYDAAADPATWPQVLAASRDYVGAQSAGLLSKDIASTVCTVHHQCGFDPHYVESYRDEYWRIDPFAVSPFFPIEQPAAIRDYVPEDEFREGRFYREWLQPQGWVDAASVVLERSPTSCSTFVIARHETAGMVDDETRMRMRHIAPHIRRAVQIGKLIDRAQTEAATLSDVLDGLSAGVFLVDAGARIIHANIAGRALLAAADFFFSVRSRLAARDSAVERTLRTALAAVAERADTAGDGAVALPLISQDSERYAAHVLPLTSRTGPRAGIAGGVIAALFVHKAAMDHPSLPESVARHYKLTPTELRVLLGIVEVGGAPEVADALGIADNTVKTHLGRLYQKTGTRRQVDLVKLVAGFSTPLVA